MFKCFVHLFVAVFFLQPHSEAHEINPVQDMAVDFTVKSWKERNDIPEPYRSEAIDKIKAMKNEEWKGLGVFFIQSLDISKEAKEKAEAKRAIVKRQTANNNQESTGAIIKELFAETLLMGAKSSEEPILEEEFRKAMKMKFNTIDDFGHYCIKVYEEVTGRKSPADDM